MSLQDLFDLIQKNFNYVRLININLTNKTEHFFDLHFEFSINHNIFDNSKLQQISEEIIEFINQNIPYTLHKFQFERKNIVLQTSMYSCAKDPLIVNCKVMCVPKSIYGLVEKSDVDHIEKKICNHENKHIVHIGGLSKPYWYCPDCKEDLGDANE